jgi:hypothetical protein
VIGVLALDGQREAEEPSMEGLQRGHTARIASSFWALPRAERHLRFPTGLDLAAEMLGRLANRVDLPYAWLTPDAAYSEGRALRRLVAAQSHNGAPPEREHPEVSLPRPPNSTV